MDYAPYSRRLFSSDIGDTPTLLDLREVAISTGSFVLCANDDQSDSSNQRDPAEDRGDGHCAFLLVGDLERAYVDVLLFVGETEAADGEADDSDDDEDEADNSCGFHEVEDSPCIVLQSFDEMQICTGARPRPLTSKRRQDIFSFNTGKEDDPAYEI